VLRRRLATAATTTPLPLEGAVDPDEYIVGPGDLFGFTAGGFVFSGIPVAVTADGFLNLPNWGGVKVAGLSLSTARARVLEALSDVEVEVMLLQPRQFYVHVAGAVPVPGRYLAMPVARVSDILGIAFSDTLHTPVANFDYQPSLRNIRLRRQDGSTRSLDLVRYLSTGETRFNPYLSDGDVIYVPAYNPAFASVYVDGAVVFPGKYDYREQDTVVDLLVLATGDPLLQDLGPVRLSRQRDDGTFEEYNLDIGAMQAGTVAPFPLQARDHVSVVQERLPGGTASVEGYVFNPGTYPIEQGRTTLHELLERAGGLRPEAFLESAYLQRQTLPAPAPAILQQHRFTLGLTRPELVWSDTLEVLQRLRMADLDYLSRAYFTQELQLQNRVSVNLRAAIQPGAGPIYLQDGDRLIIPRDEQTVFVFGQVVRPGYVAYTPGQSAQFYIDAAGGAGPLAADPYVLKAGNGEYLAAARTNISSGVMIFLDRRQDMADSPELQRLVTEAERLRADARIRTTQVVLQTASTLASLVALIISLRRN
jgi:protein involved in polysaccharide export with SLBB domain